MVVLDSSFLIAYHNERDVHHGAARRSMETLRSGEWGADAAILAVARGREADTILTFDQDFRNVRDVRVLPG